MSDKKYRPEIMKKKMDMSSYDEILLGFLIWWYVAPTIVNTFLKPMISVAKRLCSLQHPVEVDSVIL